LTVEIPIASDTNYTLRIEVLGDHFTGFVDGQEVLSVLLSAHLSGVEESYALGAVGLHVHRTDVFSNTHDDELHKVLSLHI